MFKIVQTILELFLDRIGSPVDDVLARRVSARRIDDIDRIGIEHLAGQRIDLTDALDLIVEHLDAQDIGVGMAQRDLDHIPARTEGPSAQLHVVARILLSDQPAQSDPCGR